MAIPVTSLHILRLLLQADQNLSGLQLNMRNNAIGWKQSAQAQALPIALLADQMNTASAQYQKRLGWIATAQADTGNWTRLSAMWLKLGGTGQDFADVVTPLQAVADQIGPAAKTTFAEAIAACDQILAAVDAPLSLWPE